MRATPFAIAWLDEAGEVRWHPPVSQDRLPFDAYREGWRELLGAPRWGDGSSRRGYGVDVFSECGYVCVYCGLDMDTTYEGWLQLSVDHVMPSHLANKGYPAAWIEDITNMVTCCGACNEFLNGHRMNDDPPADQGSFLALRDRHFAEKRDTVRRRHADERAWYSSRA